MASGARQNEACNVLDIDSRTVQRWKRQEIGEDRRAGPRRRPANRLSESERKRVLEVVNQPEFRDLSPKQIVPRLADLGIYLASESTIYRILREADQLKHRESSRSPVKRSRPQEFVVTGPRKVWSWDITWLKSPVRGMFYRLYMALDVWSRKIVAWDVLEDESAEEAALLFERACLQEGITGEGLVYHSDNGGPMKGATMLATLEKLGVVASFSRPRVSNDNPYSESLFRTMKYRPCYPDRPFASLDEAKEWVGGFVQWYNHDHRHSSINYVTPDERHEALDEAILEKRRAVYEAARSRHPERWSRKVRDWSQRRVVYLNPETNEAAPASAA